MFIFINKIKYEKMKRMNEFYEAKNKELRDYIEEIEPKYVGVTADKAIDIAIELLKK